MRLWIQTVLSGLLIIKKEWMGINKKGRRLKSAPLFIACNLVGEKCHHPCLASMPHKFINEGGHFITQIHFKLIKTLIEYGQVLVGLRMAHLFTYDAVLHLRQ